MVFLSIPPGPALRAFVRDYIIAHFLFDPARPIRHKRYAPQPEQGITFFARGRPSISDPLTGDVQVDTSRSRLRAADEELRTTCITFSTVAGSPANTVHKDGRPRVQTPESPSSSSLCVSPISGRSPVTIPLATSNSTIGLERSLFM